MKSIIKRIKRRASPTTASALLVPPVTTQTKHPAKRVANSSHHQAVGECATHITDSPSQMSPSSLVFNSSRVVQPTSLDKSRKDMTAGNSSHQILDNMDSFISFTNSSGTPSHASHVSTDSGERRSSHLSHTYVTQLDVENNDGGHNPSVREPSIRTFGDNPHRRNQTYLAQAVSDDSLKGDESKVYYEERHILKPVTRETIHKHTVEEVRKVKLHERHVTYIQHHVQPIIDSCSEITFQDYRIELDGSPGPQLDRTNLGYKSKLDAIIDDLIRNNRQKYETEGLQNSHTSQTVELSDVNHQAVVVHNYHIIQPVIFKPNLELQETPDQKTNKHAVLPSETEALNKTLEDTYVKQAHQLNQLIDSLQAENFDLKKSLSSALASRSSVH